MGEKKSLQCNNAELFIPSVDECDITMQRRQLRELRKEMNRVLLNIDDYLAGLERQYGDISDNSYVAENSTAE